MVAALPRPALLVGIASTIAVIVIKWRLKQRLHSWLWWRSRADRSAAATRQMRATSVTLPIVERCPGVQTSGEWTLGSKIGEGHYGAVFVAMRARDASDVHPSAAVAVKVVQGAKRAIGECVAEMARLRHSNLLDIREVRSVHKECLWIIMNFCGTEDLFSLVGTLSGSGLFRVTRELLDAVAYLHRRGYVHRDIKPENIAMIPEGARQRRLVLLDLGCLRPEGILHWAEGTPQYQPPEIRGKKRIVVRAAIDDWATGATLATVILNRHVTTPMQCSRGLMCPSLASKRVHQIVLWWCWRMMSLSVATRASVLHVRRQLFRAIE